MILTCSVTGQPIPKIQWKKAGNTYPYWDGVQNVRSILIIILSFLKRKLWFLLPETDSTRCDTFKSVVVMMINLTLLFSVWFSYSCWENRQWEHKQTDDKWYHSQGCWRVFLYRKQSGWERCEKWNSSCRM